MDNSLFSVGALGAIELPNRVIMAPMTRSRAEPGAIPGDLIATYYEQRAADGQGYCRTCGIHSEAQLEGWRKVTSAVTKKGGQIVMQLMHCGRIASRYNKANEAETIAPSAIQAKGKMFTDSHGMIDFDVPRALGIEEIPNVIEEYAQAAKNVLAAGCVGVELHATSGYLPAQFLSTGTNQRSDAYGGGVNHRIRFVIEVLEAMISAVGADKVGMRICPGNPFNDLHDDNPKETFTELLKAASALKFAYLHVIRLHKGPLDNIDLAKRYFQGPLILNDSFSTAEAGQMIDNKVAQAISFARNYIANPDLVEKLKAGTDLTKFNPKTLYTSGPEGYTDY